MPFNMYPYNQAPTVNYPTGDYRTISRLDRNRAEMTQNTRLGGELGREQEWKNALFQKKLEELMKNLYQGGLGTSVGGQAAPAYGAQIGAMGRAPQTSVDRMTQMNPELAQYLSLLRGARQITGPNANPYALGYNFGTLTGRGGYFGGGR